MKQLPEVVRGQVQAQRPVRADVLPRTRAERTAVPVQPLQVEHRLRHPPVPRLLHPQHAVHALDRAAGPDRVLQHRRDPVVAPAPRQPARDLAPPPGPASITGSDGVGRRCRSHQRQAIASRHSGRGSADSNRRCIRSRKARLRRSRRKLRTFVQSGPVRSGQRRGDLGLGADAVVEPAVGAEELQARHGPVPGPFEALDLLQRRGRPAPGGAGRPGRAPRRASTPCRFASATRRRRPPPRPRPPRRDASAGPGPGGPPSRCGRRPGRAPAPGPMGRRAAPRPCSPPPPRSPWRRRRRRTPGGRTGPVGLPRSRPCGRRRCGRRRPSCSPARSRPGSVAPKKDLVEGEGPTRGAHAGSRAFKTAPARRASAWTQCPNVEWSGTSAAGRRTPRRSSICRRLTPMAKAVVASRRCVALSQRTRPSAACFSPAISSRSR